VLVAAGALDAGSLAPRPLGEAARQLHDGARNCDARLLAAAQLDAAAAAQLRAQPESAPTPRSTLPSWKP